MKKTCPLCGAEYDSAQTFCSKDGAVLKADAAATGDLTGSVIADRYRIVKRLGEGGMGTVFLAEHVKIGRKSAVKVVKPDMAADPDAIARFIREATNASKIEHPNVANIHDFGELDDGRMYLAMEFIEGESLAAVLHREGPIAPFRAAQIVTQVAAGLQAAHDLGIVHRDLKPENIMLARHKDGSDKVKLVDFGIAKSHGDAGQKVTRTGVLIGTPAYMSPEQVAGGDVAGASDQFALACSTFEMLTGALPFEGESTFEQITSRVAGRARGLAQVRADIAWAPVLQEVLMKALSAKPEDRYPSMTAFSAAFASAVRATPGTTPTIEVPLDVRPVSTARPSAKTVATGPRAQPTTSVPETRVAPAASGSGGRGLWLGLAALVIAAGGVAAWQYGQREAAPSQSASLVATTPPEAAPPVTAPTPATVESTTVPAVDTTAAAPIDSAPVEPLKRRVPAEKAPTKPVPKPSPVLSPGPSTPDVPTPTPRPPAPLPVTTPKQDEPAPREPVVKKPAPAQVPTPAEPEPEPETPAPTRPGRLGASAADSLSVAEARARARTAVAAGDTAAACRELMSALEKTRGNRRIGALVRLNMQNLKCRP